MSRKRNMPSRKKIFEYWQHKLSNAKTDNTCFKCSATSIFGDSVMVDRAHILAVCEGGSDDVSNIHLLCRGCHKDSEAHSGDEYRLWIDSKNKEEFGKALFVLWNSKELTNTRLDLYFNKVKDDYIKDTGELMYEFIIKGYEFECESILNKYRSIP